MVKNIMAVLILGFLALFLGGCAGVLPEKPWHVYKAEQEALEQSVAKGQEVQVQEERGGGGTEIRNTYLPGEVIRNNSSVGPFSGGIEVHEENYRDEERLVITPFFGKRSPAYNEGRRNAHDYIRRMKEYSGVRRAIEKGRYDGRRGVFEPVGFSLKYLREYEDAFEYEKNATSRRGRNMYYHSEYNEGWNDILEKEGWK